MSNNNQQEKGVESEIKKPVETQVARLERERIAAEEAEEAAREAARLEAERPAYQLAAAWARQALAALPAPPAIEPGGAMDRVERTREDVANLLAVLAAEMDAEGGV